jgi:hypothetical protein
MELIETEDEFDRVNRIYRCPKCRTIVRSTELNQKGA